MQDPIGDNIKRLRNFLHYTRNYFIKNNPIKAFLDGITSSLKELMNIQKKRRMAHYRLSYQIGKLKQMEKLIAANNDHVFLKGRKFNQTR